MKPNRSIALLASIVCLTVAVAPQVLWIVVTADSAKTQEESVRAFTQAFPSFLGTTLRITFLGIVAAVLAIIFAVLAKRTTTGVRRAVAFAVLALAIVVLGLNGFQVL